MLPLRCREQPPSTQGRAADISFLLRGDRLFRLRRSSNPRVSSKASAVDIQRLCFTLSSQQQACIKRHSEMHVHELTRSQEVFEEWVNAALHSTAVPLQKAVMTTTRLHISAKMTLGVTAAK